MKASEFVAQEIREDRTIIGEGTVVRLGLVILIVVTLLGFVGGICGAVWWASSLTSDVNTIKSSMVRLNAIDAIAAKVEGLSSRIESLEKRGSEPLQNLQRTLDTLSSDMKIHIETDKATNKTPK